MKVFILIGVVLAISIMGSNAQTCGGKCTSSTSCALDANDLGCRCSYLQCDPIGVGNCGGSCVSDAQCAEWANHDEKCICTWMFECELESRTKEPGYQLYSTMMASIKKARMDKMIAEGKFE